MNVGLFLGKDKVGFWRVLVMKESEGGQSH